MVLFLLASSTARCAPFSAGLPLVVSLPDVGSSVAILIVVEPVVVVLVPVVVPAPQATRIVSTQARPRVPIHIRNQFLRMMSLPPSAVHEITVNKGQHS